MKTIVVTGCSRGCGAALAARFVEAGHVVVGCARDRERVAEMRARLGAPHRIDVVDVADDSAVAAWAESAIASHGVPDILINNAAIINRPAALWTLPAGEFDAVIDINIKGVVNVIRHFLPAMVGRKTGVVVNFSSGWGRSVSPEVAGYCATKWAIEGLTRALAEELPAGMAAIPLNPGVIDTDMLRSCWGKGASAYPDAEAWSVRAAPAILAFGPKDNGHPLSVDARQE